MQKIVLRIKIRKPNLAAIGMSLFLFLKSALFRLLNARIQWRILAAVIVLILADIYGSLSPFFDSQAYALGNGAGLLPQSSPVMATKVKLDPLQQQFTFDPNTSASSSGVMGQPTYSSATLNQDASKGITVSDSVNKVDFTMIPKFQLKVGRQDQDRIVYPLADGSGWAVYTLRGDGVKEDLIVNAAYSDVMSYAYTLQLGDSLKANVEPDGSLGIYGNTLLAGSIATGSSKDAQLLQKARQNAPKNTLLFRIPAPIISDKHGPVKDITARYSLSGDTLTVTASGMKKGNYPLTIDPSIYVVTASQFMAGNNETNINFDVDNKLIDKAPTTGARFNQWNSTTGLPEQVWGASSAAAGGYIYIAGGIKPSGQTYSSQGSGTFVVPAGVTSVTVKMWGGGGGAGSGDGADIGGNGGGSGFTQATITTTPGETLNVYVAAGGTGGSSANYSGGGGGGYSSVSRGGTPLVIAAGGGGGSAANLPMGWWCSGGNTAGVAAGAGGGTSGVGGTGKNGGGGTQAAGGAGGTGSTTTGHSGSSLAGGLGANSTGSSWGSGGGGGNNGGAAGGSGSGNGFCTAGTGGGGGGGGGYFGGGGGGTQAGTNGGSGGGGSSYTVAGATSVTNTAGSGKTPGNNSDPDNNGSGTGGTGGTGTGPNGTNGYVRISLPGGATASSSLNWSKFDTSNGTIVNADPGNGACSGWCSTSAYNLPSARANFSLVAYNGFLYAMGGVDANGNRQSTVYVAKLGANGEPRLWHPTDTNPNNWGYWYQDTGLSSTRAYFGAVAYNNHMYVIGGVGPAGTPVNSVEVANILPTGKLGSWTTTGSSFPYAGLYGHNVQVYNDRMYILGGATTIGGTPTSNVYYNKINSDGTLNAWTQTSSFSGGRINPGGNMSVIWGAYIYISGGCLAMNASGYCTSIASDTQVASINADGSLDNWDTLSNASSSRMSHNMFAWRNNIYTVGGCTAQSASTGDCNGNMLNTINYGAVNQAGDLSPINSSVASGTAPCSGASPNNCNLPGTTYIGDMMDASLINNGYIYLIGGCTNNACSTVSSNVAYASISSTGVISKPATCPGGTIQGGMWCVDTTNTVPGGVAFSSPVVFNNTIYLVGGIKTGGGNDNTGNIYYTTVNNDGSLGGGWTTQSMTGVGASNVSSTYALVRANPSSASTNPANLYIFGGCTTSNGTTCSAYTGNVYKCNITSSRAVASCTTSGQLQIGTIPEDSSAGLAFTSGAYYAGYIYLIGGSSPNQAYLSTVRYAKIDNSNNVVAASGSTWTESSDNMASGRHFAGAFGYNGYLYVVGGYNATNGVLSDIEFIKINVSDGSLVGDPSNSNKFFVSTATITGRWGLNVLVSNANAYVIGGCTTGASPSSCTARTDNVQTLQIFNNDRGTPASFSTSANTFSTDSNRVGVSAVILNGYLYAAGGCTSSTSYCTTASGDVSYAAVDSSGNLGSWSSTTASLPAHRAWGKLRVAGGTLYYIGGQSDTPTDYRTEVYYGTPSSGNVTSWSTATNGLPNARTNFGAAVWNNRLYVVGGQGTSGDCSGGVCNTVYVSPQLNSGGDITSAWSTGSTSFNVARSGTVAIAYANNLYLFGGSDGANFFSDSQYAKINTSDGSVGNWSYSASMPNGITQGDGFAANGYIYMMGGQSGTGVCNPVTYMAPISANTTIANGNNPTGVGAWFGTNQLYSGNRYGNAAAYNDGKAYVLGGSCDVAGGSYTTAGSYNYIVPSGVTSLNVQTWGAGGGGGGGSGSPGGAGAGGGYATSTITTTPGETLTVRVGGAGGAGASGSGGAGGGGGGYSGIFRSTTPLIVAAGGGGGGGSQTNVGTTGGAAGAAGGTTGASGGASVANGGGGGGTQSAGGAAGASGGVCPGQVGSSLLGGNGVTRQFFGGCDYSGGGGGGGTNGGGTGAYAGSGFTGNNGGSGGGGGGYFGGGSGAGAGNASNGGGAGGGGGSSYTTGTCGTPPCNVAGSGQTPGNNTDSRWSGYGNGGNGGILSGNGSAGTAGAVFINSGAVIYASPVTQQTALLSQPQVAKYSIMFDTDTDVFPDHWLLNGVDNSIGAQWQLKYQSMTNPGATIQCASSTMSTWGTTTNFGNVSLGLPGIYTPLDGSGNNTSCARYYFLNVSVDSSQAFGYPDDVSRGPTITDMTLHFTADPAKRLMHGRTFVGGLQMPDDTPYYTH